MNTLERTLTSNEVAEMVGKEHSKLIRDIRTYVRYLNEAKIGSVDFFIESTYRDAKGEERPNYLLTKQGCEMVSNKLTGAKGVQFTAKYVNRFNQMEKHIKESPLTTSDDLQIKRLNAEARLKNANSRQAKLLADLAKDSPSDVNKVLLHDKAVELLTGKKMLEMPAMKEKLFDCNEIAKKLGVMSKNSKPHEIAVSQIIHLNIDVAENEAEVFPITTKHWGGTVMKYTQSVIDRLENWLIDNNYPSVIQGVNKKYHVTYDIK